MEELNLNSQQAEIFEKVAELFSSVFKEEKIEIDDNLKSLADSLEMLGLLADFEDKFNIVIPDEEAQKFKTVRDVILFIEKEQK